MQAFMPIILDTLVVIVTVSFIMSSSRKGFIRTVVQFAGYLASIAIASVGSKMLSVITYDMFIRNNIITFLENNITSVSSQDMIITEIAKAIENLPPILNNIFMSNGASVTNQISSMMFSGTDFQSIIINVADTLIAPIVLMALRSVFFLLIFMIAMFFVKTFSRLFRGLNRIPLIGPVNTMLGGVVGAFEAFIFLFVLALLIDTMLILSGNSIPFISREAIDSTYLFSRFFEINFTSGFFGGF